MQRVTIIRLTTVMVLNQMEILLSKSQLLLQLVMLDGVGSSIFQIIKILYKMKINYVQSTYLTQYKNII